MTYQKRHPSFIQIFATMAQSRFLILALLLLFLQLSSARIGGRGVAGRRDDRHDLHASRKQGMTLRRLGERQDLHDSRKQGMNHRQLNNIIGLKIAKDFIIVKKAVEVAAVSLLLKKKKKSKKMLFSMILSKSKFTSMSMGSSKKSILW